MNYPLYPTKCTDGDQNWGLKITLINGVNTEKVPGAI